jgi:hypothetical protein
MNLQYNNCIQVTFFMECNWKTFIQHTNRLQIKLYVTYFIVMWECEFYNQKYELNYLSSLCHSMILVVLSCVPLCKNMKET